jgi:hypothetical protein
MESAESAFLREIASRLGFSLMPHLLGSVSVYRV